MEKGTGRKSSVEVVDRTVKRQFGDGSTARICYGGCNITLSPKEKGVSLILSEERGQDGSVTRRHVVVVHNRESCIRGGREKIGKLN